MVDEPQQHRNPETVGADGQRPGRGGMAAVVGGVGLFEWDLVGGRLWCDEGTAVLFGRPELLTEPSIDIWFEAVHPDDRELVEVALHQLVSQGIATSTTWRVVRGDDDVRLVLGRAQRIVGDDGHPTHLAGAFVDVTDLAGWFDSGPGSASGASEAPELAAPDSPEAVVEGLVGLPNQVYLMGWLTDALEDQVSDGPPVTVCIVDIDNLRLVNDSFGRVEGDRLLEQVARRIRASVRPSELVCHIGGDEFVIASDRMDLDKCAQVAERVLAALREPFRIAGRSLVVTASAGIAAATRSATPEVLVRDAGAALHRAKEATDQVVVFDEELRSQAAHRLGLAAELHEAVSRGELVLHYQPFFSFDSRWPEGVEALVRWQHPVRGLVGPGEFIPLAEESELIIEIGWWVLDQACADGADRSSTRGAWGSIWVNASGRQLERDDFAATVAAALDRHGLAPGRLGIEFTETALLHDSATAASTLAALAELGVAIAIDDFGTGESSLARLADYPVDLLKIDRAFVQPLVPGDASAVVGAIVELGHAIGATVCAEGVESPEQLQVLDGLGVDKITGFLLAHPVPAEEVDTAADHGADMIAAILDGAGRDEPSRDSG